MPRVSFLLPYRDAEGSLDEAIESVCAQRADLCGFELVLVDDASTDRSREIARAWQERDPRVHSIVGPGAGLVSALNAGLERCQGEWIARMDADDLALPRPLEKQMELVSQDTRVDVVDGCVEFFARDARGNEEAVPEGMRRYAQWVNRIVEPEDFAKLRFRESCVVHPAATLRAARLRELGAYRDDGPEDFELWLRMHENGFRFRKVPEVLVRMRDHPQRATRTSARYARAAFVRVAMEAMLRGPLAAERAFCLIGGGTRGRAWQRGLAERDRVARAIVDVHPARIGSERGGVPIVGLPALAQLDVEFALVTVGGRDTEDALRAEIARQRPAWREGRDYYFVVV